MQMRMPRWTATGAFRFLSRFLALCGIGIMLVAAGEFLHASPLNAAGVAGKSGLQMPRFVSLKACHVNARVGPGEDYKIAWVFTRTGLPRDAGGGANNLGHNSG